MRLSDKEHRRVFGQVEIDSDDSPLTTMGVHRPTDCGPHFGYTLSTISSFCALFAPFAQPAGDLCL